VAKGKKHGAKLSVFKGREAKLNMAVFHVLALKGPLTAYDLHKEVKAQKSLKHTKYTNVLRRIKALEESGYIEKAGTRKIKTHPHYQTNLYQLTPRAYLAILVNKTNLDEIIQKASRENILALIAALIQYTSYSQDDEVT
jgi:Fe2+ or Zn2+ uptake regulation protein